MYIRHDAEGNVVYVPEDRPDRDWVPTCDVRSVDPPVRRNFINSLTPRKRANALIRGYLETRVGCKDQAESRACRSFLKAWHAIEADGNEMGVDLAIVGVSGNRVVFFFTIEGIGQVTWLPALAMASNERTTHILREIDPNRVAIAPPKRAPASDEEEPRRRRIPPKVETTFIPGKRF